MGDDIELGDDIDFEGGAGEEEEPVPDDFIGILEGSTPDVSDDEEDDIKDITGMQLSNPNYFFNRMDQRDSSLFLKNREGKYNAYSRMCPSNVRRQPVILTDKEKEKIDREHPGSYNHAIKYGSDPEKQYWYICPRYWCMTSNTSLTEEEVERGVCGGRDAIIPFGARTVPEGKSIFEFNAEAEHKGPEGEYIDHYPGFIPGDKHPDGHCMPCCFKTWDAPSQVKRRNECAQKMTMTQDLKPDDQQKTAQQEDYIMGPDKFPLKTIDGGIYHCLFKYF